MTLGIRTIVDSDLTDWLLAFSTAFLRPPVITPEEVELRRPLLDLARTQGAFDDGRCVATFRSFAQEVTAVGGAAIPTSAVTSVGVCPTHHRRGLLRRMMEVELAAAKDRGEVLASLISAEYPIYGRFGFGTATWAADWRVDVTRAQLDPRWSGPGDDGSVQLVDGAEVRALGPELHERFRAGQPGAVSRGKGWWELDTGAIRFPTLPWTEPFHTVYRDSSGQPQGLLTYTVEESWQANLPTYTAEVRSLIATTPAAERALWRYVLSIDWITQVVSGRRPVDDVLPLLLGDPRAARISTITDHMWLRPLDVPRMLEARSYPVAGSLVWELRDAAGLAGGRFRLDASPDGASCVPTSRSADLDLGVAELGALYLGDESVSRLVALGRVVEERPGAAALADTLLRTSRRPWCPDIY